MSVADRLYRRVMMAIAPVKITATDDTGPIHKAQIRGYPPETIDNMPVAQLYGVASHAMPGSDAVAVFGSGDRSSGMIVATNHQKFRLRNLAPGEVALYTDEGDKIVFQRGRIVELTAGTELRINTPKLTITGSTVAFNADQSVTITSPQVTVKSPNFSSSA